jgi:hypothetical protein
VSEIVGAFGIETVWLDSVGFVMIFCPKQAETERQNTTARMNFFIMVSGQWSVVSKKLISTDH